MVFCYLFNRPPKSIAFNSSDFGSAGIVRKQASTRTENYHVKPIGQVAKTEMHRASQQCRKRIPIGKFLSLGRISIPDCFADIPVAVLLHGVLVENMSRPCFEMIFGDICEPPYVQIELGCKPMFSLLYLSIGNSSRYLSVWFGTSFHDLYETTP